MRQCIFCNEKANSKEHLWPDWILKRLKIKEKLRHSIGDSPTVILDNPELLIKCVCENCNHGWMSRLETANIPTIGSLMQDISLWLDKAQQCSIALWAMKTAMVVERVNTRNRTECYNQIEREELRLHCSLPIRTEVWLGRYSRSSFGAFGTDIWIDLPEVTKAGYGCATTIVVGHLAIQILTIHVRPEHSHRTITVQPKVGPWERLLISIWPAIRTMEWPPPLTFTNEGTLSIATLMDRWRIGKTV